MSTAVASAAVPTTRVALDLARIPLPPVSRPDARLAVLDTTEWFAPTSGGIRTYLLQKQAYVAARDWLRHALVVPWSHDGIVEQEGARWYEFAGPRVPRNEPYRLLTSVARMRRVLDHERPDVIEIGSPAIVPWVVFRALGARDVPVVNFFHSHFPQLLGGSRAPVPPMRARLRDAAWWYARRMDRHVSATIAASRFVADDLEAAGIPNVVRIPLGVDLEHFTPARRVNGGATRASWSLPADGPLVTFVGRFAHEKELDVLMRAWPEIERRTGATLVMAGDGPERAALQAKVAGRRVHWLPFIADRARLADLQAASTVYMATSPHETFGLSPLEAMACGTPVLAADGGGVREHVLSSGAGRVFAPGDSHDLVKQAVTLLGEDLAAHGARARAFAEREHSWESVFDRVFALYERVRR
ncbi:MAG TPA: glycosyltransferase [Gemmatimonadaceae bacterium]|nr:glycosyltransferase [Gemmatimonadaceae bacterium]